MKKEIIYRRSRRDIIMYILLSLMGDLGSIYAIQVNSVAIGMIGLVGFGSYTIYLIIRLISPNVILEVNESGIKTQYTKGEYLSWNEIGEIYIDNDEYKEKPVNVIAIKMKKEGEENRKIRFPKPRNKVRGDYNVNLQYSDGNLEQAYKEIREFYKNYIE